VELLDQIIAQVLAWPVWAAWVVIVLATFISEDLTCVGAGLLAARGDMTVVTALGASATGILAGDLLLYWAGHSIGRRALRKRPLAWVVHEDDVRRSAAWFARRGPAVILIGRFLPGSRLPTYFAAGLLGIGFWRFTLLALVGVAIWAPLLAGGAMALGRGVLPWVQAYERWALPALLGILVVLGLLVKVVLPSFTWRGRRMVVSRWRRLTRWEFWPPWMFYPPVLLYVLWLALRHGSLSLLTAVNPGLFAGGFVGESKAEIMDKLGQDDEHVARTERIPAELAPAERLERVRDFQRRQGLEWPVVLKPDAGQRGSGVTVVRGEDEARAYLEHIAVDCVVQEYVDGLEFGLFYVRRPSEARGHIFSITSKVFPKVVGDGRSTLEHLILHDGRAVSLARLYLDRNSSRLAEVPADGEEVQLVEIGNHARGAVFLDGTHLRTRDLEEAVDRVSRRFEGFYFGRYDVRVPSEEDLRRGRAFKVIELNGATSEATHIYDPRYGVLQAWRTLFEQWRLLFEIAAENRARGARTVRWTELLRLMTHYRAAARSHPS
jgi:membrane protein DedA with SNARE-associated domain